MLPRGGNAFDAIAAAAVTLNLVEPFMSGLAGAGAATFLHAGTGEVACIDCVPPTPARLKPMETDGGVITLSDLQAVKPFAEFTGIEIADTLIHGMPIG